MAAPEGSDDAPTAPPVLAFFDIDNTLMRGASLFHIGTAAWRRGFVTGRDVAKFLWHQVRFTAVGENPRHQASARAGALRMVEGRTEQDLIELANDTYERSIHLRLIPDTVALAHEHRDKGHEVWLLSATPQVMAEVIAERLGLTGGVGTQAEIVDGVYTGNLVDSLMHGQRKADRAAELARDRGAPLADCWAYSDSRNDLPLLTLAGNRVVVNPDSALERHATSEGWPILTAKPASVRAARRRIRREGRTVAPEPQQPSA